MFACKLNSIRLQNVIVRRLIFLHLLITVNIVLILNCSTTNIHRYEDPAKADIAKRAELKIIKRGKEV